MTPCASISRRPIAVPSLDMVCWLFVGSALFSAVFAILGGQQLVTPNQIFAGMMPYMLIVILCMVFMYVWPGMTLWLPNYLRWRLVNRSTFTRSG